MPNITDIDLYRVSPHKSLLSKSLLFSMFPGKSSRAAAWYGNQRLDQRNNTLEFQELLETTVSLIITIASGDSDSNSNCGANVTRTRTPTGTSDNINQDNKGGGECQDPDQDGDGANRELQHNVALSVATMCAVESARPVAVREGVLKVLVRWLSSGDVDLVLPAANALRDLTSPDDEYMAGWIHSQIVNEGALPAIVKLSAADLGDIRLAAAQILSGLSVAPHTRAAIVEAKGLNYLVQLLVNSSEADAKWDEPLALAAGNALLQLAAGAMMHAAGGWDRIDIEQGVNSVIK